MPIQTYWREPNEENRNALRSLRTFEGTKWQYVHGVADETAVAPEAYWLDYALLCRPGNDEIQLELFGNLRDERGALSEVPRLFCRSKATNPRCVAQE